MVRHAYEKYKDLSETQQDAAYLLEEAIGRDLLYFCGIRGSGICIYAVGNDLHSYTRIFGAWLEKVGYDVTNGGILVRGNRAHGFGVHLHTGRRIICWDNVRDESSFKPMANYITKNWKKDDIQGFAYGWLSPESTETRIETYNKLEELQDRLSELNGELPAD